MKKMKNFMVIHRDPDVRWDEVEENWSKLVHLEPATWLRTYFNVDEKVRFCLWLAPDKETLKKVFEDFLIRWESILEVEETIPDIWARKYRAQMEAEDRDDTATSSQRLARESTS